MIKKALLIILASLVLVSCGLRWEGQGPGPRDEGSPPQILASYAEQVVRPAGYVFLKTPADRDLVWEQFQAKLFVRDRRGNRSNSIQLPLSFDQVSADKPPEQWRVATVVSIGAVNIDLTKTQGTDSGR